MKKLFLSFSVLLSLCCAVNAQAPMVPNGAGAGAQQSVALGPSTNTPGTITATSAFQTALAAPVAPAVRGGCLIQNQGTNGMSVNLGGLGSATLAKSITLLAGQTFSCAGPNGVVQDVVNITGTAGDAFLVVNQ